jgi:hypothetical protein
MKTTVSQQTTVLQQTYINKTVAFRRVGQKQKANIQPFPMVFGLFLW